MTVPNLHHVQTIPFHDCDPLGIVWHGHYYKYLEIARTNLLDACGLTIPWFVENRIKLVVIESRLRYASPLQYGHEVEVRPFFKDFDQRLNIGYEVRNRTTGKRAARGRTSLVPLIGDEMPMITPPVIREKIEAFLDDPPT